MVPTSTLMNRVFSVTQPESCMFHLTIPGLCMEMHDFRKKAPSRLLIGAVWFEHVYL